MKAVVYTEYGAPEVLSLQDVEKPTPGDNEVLIRVMATTVTAADGMMRRGDTAMSRVILGLRRPRRRFRTMGLELAGRIEQIGRDVTRFREGDRVFGFTGFSVGAYAEFACMPENGSLARLPGNVSYEEAASLVDGPTTALYFLRDRARVRRGDKVLVIGASGSIGTAAVQLARHFGAKVTAVCSGGNEELVRSLGAHEVVDYTRQDFTQNGERYDVIFDTVGRSSFFRCKGSLRDGGRYLLTVGGPRHYFLDLWTRLFSRKRLIHGMSIHKNDALRQVRELVEAGELRPVIDRRYPLAGIPEAHAYVDRGHKKGNVVVAVG